ncbi:hypothetical protein D9619_000997 [Psilocybe cf. subviscida]|uniref:Uncharacterized protein n=1 Tax=Psilocybe cf. subviscida TaxID=2480587 RepID=A0A8H5F2C1_9AGAR|nr:hypothetical protein D9619_000997 [Psilocybe cf. subviscida]
MAFTTTLWSWIFIFQLMLARPGFAAPIKHNYEVLVRRAASRVFIRDEFSVSATKSAIALAVSISASVLLFACLLGLAIVFRRSRQRKTAESEGGAPSQHLPWWIHESKAEKADLWWASPKLSPTNSQASLGRAQDPRPVSAEYAHLQIPALVLNGKPLKSTPTRPRIAITRSVGAPRSPAGRRRNWVRHPFLPPKTPVEVLFAVNSKSRTSPPHRRPAPPAPLKLRDHRPRKTNKVQRLAVSPFPINSKP